MVLSRFRQAMVIRPKPATLFYLQIICCICTTMVEITWWNKNINYQTFQKTVNWSHSGLCRNKVSKPWNKSILAKGIGKELGVLGMLGISNVRDLYRSKPGASLVTQMVKKLPAMWETWVWSLGQEDPPEKGMATHSSILAWEIPWTEQPGGLPSTGSQRVRHDWATDTVTFTVTPYPSSPKQVSLLQSPSRHTWEDLPPKSKGTCWHLANRLSLACSGPRHQLLAGKGITLQQAGMIYANLPSASQWLERITVPPYSLKK